MRDLLRYVVTDGTGKKADVPGYDVGGKTGSAQVPGPMAAISRTPCAPLLRRLSGAQSALYRVSCLLDQPHGTKETGGFALAGLPPRPWPAVIQRIAPLLGVPNIAPPTKLAVGYP
jgi:cell division protein FtsI (penicillin-binding protein 3)